MVNIDIKGGDSMQIIKAKIIPEPEPNTRTVFVKPEGQQGPFITGEGDINYVCGSCQVVLAQKAQTGQVSNIVFKCPKCQKFNEI
jgi:hypothetical protein